jgi:ribosome-associated translation inhibitor RaiA
MSKSDNEQRDLFGERVLHVGAGFKEKERSHVVETLSTLGPRLGRWDPDDMDVEVSLQDRGGKEQRVTLRTSLPGLPPLVAVADHPDLTRALCEAKRELIRQIEHQKSARKPMNNGRLPVQAASPGRFDVDLKLGGVGLHGVLVGECFLMPNSECVLLRLIADGVPFDVAL